MRTLTANSLRMMERSMEFLWAKQAAHLDNIANAETPGYKVKTVTFEESFDAALRSAQVQTRPRMFMRRAIEQVSWKVDDDDEVTRMDENGVNVLEQSLEAVRTAYQLQYTMQSISNDLARINAAIKG